MADFQMTDLQRLLIGNIPKSRLTLVQYIGRPEGRMGLAPAPSSVLIDEFNIDNTYGRVVGGQLLYVLKEDARYSQYFKASKAQVKIDDDMFTDTAPPKVSAKKVTPKGKVTVER